ncbi:MAG: MarR family winged helix-turn-helix transcriptional regulator [Aristaeellaceae bacterium]
MTGKQERLNRLMNLHFASFFEDMPLTSTQALALEFVIERAAEGEVYQKDLEAFLAVRGSSVTSLINNLERDGYIRREPVKFDGRYRSLVPTGKALDIQAEISRRIDRYMDSLFVGIPEEELRVFDSVLEQMTRNVR